MIEVEVKYGPTYRGKIIPAHPLEKYRRCVISIALVDMLIAIRFLDRRKATDQHTR